MKSFFRWWLQTQKKLKNFMRIGSSKASAASALHCLTENKHNKVFFHFSRRWCFLDCNCGWNSWVKFFFWMWKHEIMTEIHPFMAFMNALGHDYGLQVEHSSVHVKMKAKIWKAKNAQIGVLILMLCGGFGALSKVPLRVLESSEIRAIT